LSGHNVSGEACGLPPISFFLQFSESKIDKPISSFKVLSVFFRYSSSSARTCRALAASSSTENFEKIRKTKIWSRSTIWQFSLAETKASQIKSKIKMDTSQFFSWIVINWSEPSKLNILSKLLIYGWVFSFASLIKHEEQP